MLQAFTAALFLALSAGPGLAQGLPAFDVEATCREAQPLGPEDRDPYQGCLKDERTARTELQRVWGGFEAADRSTCVQETELGGYPSYVELLTCLQMYKGPPTTPLKTRRRGD
jgi:hypothetical protein